MLSYEHFNENENENLLLMKKIQLMMAFFLITLLSFSCNKEKIITDFTGSTFTQNAKGCGAFFVYKFNADKDLSITVRGDRDALNLNTSEQEFELGNAADLSVKVAQFNKSAPDFYCNDIVEEGAAEKIHSWDGINGTVRIQITEDSISVSEYELIYKVSVKIEDVEFMDSNGNTQEVDAVEFSDVRVGWLPG